ncbi:unnamed protein product [Paramecium octaurelia]|uniref:CRAL-TRIO domain-containing protein n=1 Tax=Paramecium octaurelia TaxID=43137 RepID=A0A8S1VDD8_PAROT|nr:unnamed protein product [Paramecium octaurelia]
MQKLFGSTYDYLTISPNQARAITHPATYVKEGTGKQAIRKIYGNGGGGVPFDQYEQQMLGQLKTKLNGMASHYPDTLLYRFLYSFRFGLDETYNGIKSHEEWLNNPSTFQLNSGSQAILDKGIIYMGGRDKKFRPSVIFQVGLIDQKNIKGEEFLAALNTVFMITQQYCFYEGFVENWIILIDTAELGLLSLPIEILKKIISTAASHYVGNLEKLYLLNPSMGLNMSWSLVSKFIDERSNKKIQFLQKKDFSKLQEYFDPSQLEVQFGGTMPKIKQYWPPQPTIQIEKPQEQQQTYQIQNYEPSVRSQRSKRSEPYNQQKYQAYQAPFKKPQQESQTLNLQESLKQEYFDSKMNLPAVQPTQQASNKLIQSRQTDERPSQLTQNFGYESSIQKPQRLEFQNVNSESSREIQHISFQDFHFASQPQSNQQSNQGKQSYRQNQNIEERQLSKFPVIEEEPYERKSQFLQQSNGYPSESKNFVEEPLDSTRFRQSQSLRKSYKQYHFSKSEFHPPYPNALPAGPVVLGATENQEEEFQKKENKQIPPPTYQQPKPQEIKPYQTAAQQQELIPPPQPGILKRTACFQARDGKYTACDIF